MKQGVFLQQGTQRKHKGHKENSVLSESLVILMVKQGVILPQGAQRKIHKVHKENSALSASLVILVVKQGAFLPQGGTKNTKISQIEECT